MNIDREFIKWFYEEEYPELGCNRRQVYGMTHGTTNINVIDYWMREAYRAGANAAQKEQSWLENTKKDPRYQSESLT